MDPEGTGRSPHDRSEERGPARPGQDPGGRGPHQRYEDQDPGATPERPAAGQPPPAGDEPERQQTPADDGAPADRAAPAEERAAEPVPFTQQLGRALLVVLAILFGVFAVVNAHFVDFSWVFGSTQVVTDAAGERVSGGVPLIVLLVASFLAGAVIAWAVTAQVARSRRLRERRLERERRQDG